MYLCRELCGRGPEVERGSAQLNLRETTNSLDPSASFPPLNSAL